MISISASRVYRPLLVDTITILAGTYMVTREHLEYQGTIDDPNMEDYSDLRISGYMMRRYNIKYGQIFKKIAVLEGHHPYEPERFQKFAILIGDDCENQFAIDVLLHGDIAGL